MAQDFKYSAFISYSHADRKIVQWLHRTLEGYRLPRHLVGKETTEGVIPKKLKPFFRDRDDLAASTDLGESVRTAMRQSKFLIVVCSPEAAKSEWVNQEILEFKKLRDEQKILCLIVGGEPNASATSRGQSEECFPPALRKISGKKRFEPIAADARPGGDGKRLAKLKIVAGMLGIDLGTLVQRESQRRQRQLAAVSFGSLAGVVILGGLLFITLDAKRDAEQRRAQTENMVEFMIDDLQGPLDSIGNLQLLDSVGREVLDFYASLDPGELDEDALAKRSRALLMIGRIEDLRGNLDDAQQFFTAAYQTTEELLARDPENPTRIFDHSQTLFYLGYLDWRRGNLDEAEVALRSYSDLSGRLLAMEPDNPDWQAEVSSAHMNLGAIYLSRSKFYDAVQEYERAEDMLEKLAAKEENSVQWRVQLAQIYGWLSDSYRNLGNLQNGVDYRLAELDIYTEIRETDPGNTEVREAIAVTHRALGRLNLDQGKIEIATGFLEQAIGLGESLLTFDPENTMWAERLAATYLDYGEVLILNGALPEARETIAKALKMSGDLMDQDSTVIKWKIDLYYRGLLVSAAHVQASGDHPKGRAITEGAVEGLTTLREENPDNTSILDLLGYGYFLSGEFHDSLGEREQANDAWGEAVNLLTPHEQDLRLETRDILARVYLRLGLRKEADRIAAELRSIGYRHPAFTRYWQKWGAL